MTVVNPISMLVGAIWGAAATVSGGCCAAPMLAPLDHPYYRCKTCGKKVHLVKVTKIKVKVVDESSERSKP